MHDPHRIEFMGLDAGHHLLVEAGDLAGDAEGAVAHMPAGAAADLADFGGRQVAVLVAVELAVLGEGDMVDIEIEAHADRIGGHQIFDVAA